MAIKHSVVKVSGESGYAIEWNDEHIIDSDINFNNFSGINVGEPIASSDIATKNYVDTMGAGIPSAIASSGQATFTENQIGTSWHDVLGAAVTVTVLAGQKVLILVSCNIDIDTFDADCSIKLLRDMTELTGTLRAVGNSGIMKAPAAIQYLDDPGEGTYTYKLQGVGDVGDEDILYGLITVIAFN